MSVRDGLLAILSLGPAYGLQLHSELASRSPHRGPVNVGQIYATLDRLVARGLVAYDARELPPLLGRKTTELDPEYRREIVHRDEMVLVGRRSGA